MTEIQDVVARLHPQFDAAVAGKPTVLNAEATRRDIDRLAEIGWQEAACAVNLAKYFIFRVHLLGMDQRDFEDAVMWAMRFIIDVPRFADMIPEPYRALAEKGAPTAGMAWGMAAEDLLQAWDGKDLSVLGRAITRLRLAALITGGRDVPEDHGEVQAIPRRERLLTNLCAALGTWCVLTRSFDCIDEAITRGREAIATTSQAFEYRHACAYNLSVVLMTRYKRDSSQMDLEECCAYGREAIWLTPPDFVEYAGRVTHLRDALRERHRRTGSAASQAEATALEEKHLTSRRLIVLGPNGIGLEYRHPSQEKEVT